MGQALTLFRDIHTFERVNKEDPDDGKCWLCSACTLPIFSTPFISRGKLLLHEGCSNLPHELVGQMLHPWGRLVRMANKNSLSCVKCKRKGGSRMYECPERSCGLRLDLLCALQVTIAHRFHKHRLMVITGSASFMCGACGTQHPGFSSLSYLCKGCDFWIHPDCASLPNAITLVHHHHSLYLYTPSYTPVQDCAICGRPFGQGMAVYFCVKCGYYAHIKCAVSDPHTFKPVLIRDAKLAGLRHFSMADQHSSVMRYIMEGDDDEVDEYESKGELFREDLHQHPLMFHDEDGDEDEDDHVCNACVELISSHDPFYRCSECPDFFLHKCCANLPSQILDPIHDHTLCLFPKAPNSSTSGSFLCRRCQKWCNRYAYSCNTCGFIMDVVCAMMPPSITHHLHSKSHILFINNDNPAALRSNTKVTGVSYKCSTCPNFEMDTWSAQLPSSCTHKFDEHPLKLTASDDHPVNEVRICEICEDDIVSYKWRYSCSQCEQSFHCDCIHGFSNFKLGGTIRVDCHDCPLTLVPETTVYGYHCDYCHKVFTTRDIEEQKPAYECSKCYFRIHDECAGECLKCDQ